MGSTDWEEESRMMSARDLASVDYSYDYPFNLDLKPGHPFHDRLLKRILDRAQMSREQTSRRFSSWKKIDETLTAYIPLDKEEKRVKADDDRKPVSIVVPVSYATLETLLTYWVQTFLQDPLFRYEGVGPEDQLNAILLEKVIEIQTRRAKCGLQLHTMWRDALAYGVGAVSVHWEKEMARRTVVVEDTFWSMIRQGFIRKAKRRETVEAVVFEGNRLENIDPYSMLPDPNVPIQDVQRGEFFGWLWPTNRLTLLDEELSGGPYFNVQYLRHINGTSRFSRDKFPSRDRDFLQAFGTGSPADTKPVDVVQMYVKLIPKEWGLHEGEKPEKWLFSVAGDSVVIQADQIALNHDRFPVAVCAPDYDGYSVTPISRMEVIYGLQEFVNWQFNSHAANVRKAINDMLIIDPSLINVNDLREPGPGKIIRTRRSAWGRGVEGAVKQLAVQDITRNHMQDIAAVMDLIQRITSASDSLQGIMRHSGERRSAAEARDSRLSALSRLERAGRIGALMAHQDIAMMFASQTQQFMSESMWVKAAGRWEEILRNEYGNVIQQGGRIPVGPFDVLADFDVQPHDDLFAGGEFSQEWVTLYQILASNREVGMQFDMTRIFMHIARLMGAKNINDFVRSGGNVAPTVMPDQQVLQQAQAGNLVPVEQFAQAGVGAGG